MRKAPNDTDALTLHIGPQRLTDGSLVYNVHIGNSDVVLHAYDEASARALAHGIEELIDRHTCDTVHVRNWEVQAA